VGCLAIILFQIYCLVWFQGIFEIAQRLAVIGGKVDCLNFLKRRGTVLLKNKQG